MVVKERKKVLIFGGTGMAGHMIYYYLDSLKKYNISNVVYRNKLTEDSIVIDVTNVDQVERVVVETKPDIIINCIGVLVNGSKSRPDNAILLNAFFPHLLERLSRENNGKLIHISTDCVFSGKKGYYTEVDYRDADDVYGRSKALGEVINETDLTLRTSIIGPEIKTKGEGLFHWFMTQEGNINGYSRAIWGGVTTLELAKAIEKSIEHNLTGLIHVSNGLRISKFELLNLFKKIWDRTDITIHAKADVVSDKSICKSELFDFNIPSYESMLKDQYEWINTHHEMYTNYIK